MVLRGREPWCPACTEGRYDYLGTSGAATLCGRDAVQIRPETRTRLDLPALAERLARTGPVRVNEYLVRFTAPEAELVVFEDGRAIVKGVGEPSRARSLYAKYVGS
jgi:adenylyltransferase/sulfurtransferase